MMANRLPVFQCAACGAVLIGWGEVGAHQSAMGGGHECDTVDAIEVGREYVWEPAKPHAWARVRVERIWSDADGEWWVTSRDLATGEASPNEAARFAEAVAGG